MLMPPLRLDFSDSNHRARRKTMFLALLGAALVMFALLQYREVAVQVAEIETNDAAMQGSRSEQPPSQEEMETRRALEKVASRLSISWEKLLDSISAAVVNNVVLLSFQPNAVRGELQITGAATKLPAVLEFVERLRAQPALKDVYLKNHEISEEEKGKFPVRFTIALKWQGSLNGEAQK